MLIEKMINMDEKYFREVYIVAVDEYPYVFHSLSDASDFLNYVVKENDDVTLFFKKSKVLVEDDLDYDEMYNTLLFRSWKR